jgi:hypothetical protein
MTPKKHDRHRIPDELIDQLLANYQKPEDLTLCPSPKLCNAEAV